MCRSKGAEMLNKCVFRGLLQLIAAATLATGGCSGSGDDGYGASGGSSTTSGNTYIAPTCDQTCQDFLVAYGLNDTIWFAWGQHLTGRPSGPQDVTGTCPFGGTVHIIGTTTVSGGFDVVDLTFELASCANSDSVYDLTFTGSVEMDGSFDSDTHYSALLFSSTSLEVSGELDYYDQPQVDESCGLSCAQEGGGDSWKLKGQICGRTFNSETALDTGSETDGSTGSGGGGNSSGGSNGGGSNSCRCYCPDGSDCTGASEPNPCGVDEYGIPDACGCPVDC
jgi:hypothetical protein